MLATTLQASVSHIIEKKKREQGQGTRTTLMEKKSQELLLGKSYIVSNTFRIGDSIGRFSIFEIDRDTGR